MQSDWTRGSYKVFKLFGSRVTRANLLIGSNIEVFYDPLISKLIVHGADRTEALRLLRQALGQYEIAALSTNIEFLRSLAEHPAFIGGELETGFIAVSLPLSRAIRLNHFSSVETQGAADPKRGGSAARNPCRIGPAPYFDNGELYIRDALALVLYHWRSFGGCESRASLNLPMHN
jgi:acetyl/propionyl-CoA carboxylase alpha subunit